MKSYHSVNDKGQTAVEYLLIFTIAAIVALLAFTTFLPKSQEISTEFFNTVAKNIMGNPPSSSDIISGKSNN